MEGCSKDAGIPNKAQQVAVGVWDAPPPGVVERLVQEVGLISRLRLLNSKWRGEVDCTVRRVGLRVEGLSEADIEKRVAALSFKFPRIDTILCETNEPIRAVADVLGGKLLHLEISNWEADELEPSSELSNLKTLRVKGGQFGFLELVPLSTMTRLTELEIEFTEVLLLSEDALTHLINLECLCLGRVNMGTLDFVGMLTKLVELSLTTVDEDLDFGALSVLTKLTFLDLCDAKSFDDDAAACLSCLVNLSTLRIHWTSVSDVGFCNIAHLTKLRCLNVSCENVTEVGFDPIGCLTGLQTLIIGYLPSCLQSGHFLSHLTNLRRLNLSRYVQNGAMPSIASLASLRDLTLVMNDIENDAFMLLGALEQLKWASLSIYARSHMQEPLSEWPCLPQLTKLQLWGKGWVDKSLAHLSRMEKLEVLEVHTEKITNNGIRHLTKLTWLKELKIHCVKVSKECEEALKEALSFCIISRTL